MWAIHTFKKGKYKQVSALFSNPLISFQGGRGREQLRTLVGTHTGQDTLPSQGHSRTPTLTQTGTV